MAPVSWGVLGSAQASASDLNGAPALFLMACDAYGRGEPRFAEVLIQRANQYADQAAGLRSEGDKQLQQKDEC